MSPETKANIVGNLKALGWFIAVVFTAGVLFAQFKGQVNNNTESISEVVVDVKDNREAIVKIKEDTAATRKMVEVIYERWKHND